MLVKLGVGHEGTIQPPAFAKRSHTFECRTWETIYIYIEQRKRQHFDTDLFDTLVGFVI